MKEFKVPVQSLIDHIKTAVDVDPWAKEMAEELLKKNEAVKPVYECEEPIMKLGRYHCGKCHCSFDILHVRYCPLCGQAVKWE